MFLGFGFQIKKARRELTRRALKCFDEWVQRHAAYAGTVALAVA
jgi:hypothetical protein